MKRFYATALALSLATAALAQGAPMVTGTVQKVDASAEKITLNHGPIPNLDMGAMTMVFKAADKRMLGQVKPGDKVQFTADRVNGQLTVTKIQKAK
jgi:Cu(I)/Ag(I) efflux system protein CusF